MELIRRVRVAVGAEEGIDENLKGQDEYIAAIQSLQAKPEDERPTTVLKDGAVPDSVNLNEDASPAGP
jgi:hypothetical protein